LRPAVFCCQNYLGMVDFFVDEGSAAVAVSSATGSALLGAGTAAAGASSSATSVGLLEEHPIFFTEISFVICM